MDIVVIGASGSVGREVVSQLVASHILERNERLQLVGRKEGKSAHILYGLATDIMDAYAEICPEIDVALSPEEVAGDIIVMAAGATLPVEYGGTSFTRDDLAKINIPVFNAYAQAIAKYGHGNEIIIVVTNPNELAVEIFSRHIDRQRVIGMGAYLDSLRFRKEIAIDTSIRRQQIHGFMVGEHGFNLVPLWSTVEIYGLSNVELKCSLNKIRLGYKTTNFKQDLESAKKQILGFIQNKRIKDAYDSIDNYPPDLRVALKPFITHFSGSKTAISAAGATVDLVKTITLGHDALISGQIRLEGEFYDVRGTVGVPFVIGNQGMEGVLPLKLLNEEIELFRDSAHNVQTKINEWLG